MSALMIGVRESVDCEVCGKRMRLPPSLAANKRTCSKICDAELRRTRVHRICKYCGKDFIVKPSRRHKYCSVTCSGKGRSFPVEKVCEVCGVKFLTVPSDQKNRRFCSKKCTNIAQSNGLVRIHSYGNYGYRKDLGVTFRSSLEANYARLLNFWEKKWKYEPKSFSTPMGNYTPDFYLPEEDFYVELRGHPRRSLEKAKMAASIHGFDLRFILQSDLYQDVSSIISSIPWWESGLEKIGDFDPRKYSQRVCRCGKEFLHRNSKTNIGQYCSPKCANKYKWEKPHSWKRRNIVHKICPTCKKTFKTIESTHGERIYCSTDCYHISLVGRKR
jgi:hypothetical protein